MGLSYMLMLIAFYMDNEKELPVWKHLPSVTHWLAQCSGSALNRAGSASIPQD
jgi:hypothetical protein